MSFSHALVATIAAGSFMSAVATMGPRMRSMVADAIPGYDRTAAIATTTADSPKPPPAFEGSDVDGNRVRDDVDALIVSLPDTTVQKAALARLARAQILAIGLIDWDHSDQSLRKAAVAMNSARRCTLLAYPQHGGDVRAEQVRRAVANTDDRVWRLVRFNALAEDYHLAARSCETPEG